MYRGDIMLNEKKVKHMVKLAIYENKEGVEELKVSEFYKKDYISFNMIWSIIWTTIAYVIVVVLGVMTEMNAIMENLSMKLAVILGGTVVGGYIVALILCIVLSRRYYKRKHARAYHRVKRFKEGLSILEDMYREENSNG